MLLHERLRRLRALAVAVDRSALAVPLDAVVPDRDLDDVGVVGGLAGDDEGLGQLQPDDARFDLHERLSRRSTRRRRRRPPGSAR